MSQNIEDKNFFILPDVGAIIADIDKSRKMLGFNPKTNIAKGIGNFIDWLQEFYNYK